MEVVKWVFMKTETIGNFEVPQIPLSILKDMGFEYENFTRKWVLNIGNPLVWYELKLPEFPTWVDFRRCLCDVISEAHHDGGNKMRLKTYFNKQYRFLEVGEVITAGDLIDIEEDDYEDAKTFIGLIIDESFSPVIRPYKVPL